MADLTPKTVYQAYRDDQKTGPLHKPLLLARILAISVACLGAIPTGYNLYMSWMHGIPYSQVSHRLEQYDLWVKNFECKIDYRSVTAGQSAKVDVGACPKSGDIALKVTTTTGKTSYEWISYAQLELETKSALLSLASSALAEEAPAVTPGALAVPQFRQLAQSAAPSGDFQVHCQVMPSPGKIMRIVTEGGKCYRVFISAYQGRAEKREEVPCNTQCGPGKG